MQEITKVATCISTALPPKNSRQILITGVIIEHIIETTLITTNLSYAWIQDNIGVIKNVKAVFKTDKNIRINKSCNSDSVKLLPKTYGATKSNPIPTSNVTTDIIEKIVKNKPLRRLSPSISLVALYLAFHLMYAPPMPKPNKDRYDVNELAVPKRPYWLCPNILNAKGV